MERKNNLHWHSTYLEKYISENLVPFGLRIKLFPHFKNLSTDFKGKWEKTLPKCSLSLMKLLVDEHKTELTLIDNKLQPLNQKLSTLKNTAGLVEKEQNIGETLERLSRETITRKENKLLRGRKAFNNSKAYIWPNSQLQKRSRPHFSQLANSIPRNTSFSESSVSSVSSYSSFSHLPKENQIPSEKDKRTGRTSTSQSEKES